MGPTGCSETSVTNYQTTLRNVLTRRRKPAVTHTSHFSDTPSQCRFGNITTVHNAYSTFARRRLARQTDVLYVATPGDLYMLRFVGCRTDKVQT